MKLSRLVTVALCIAAILSSLGGGAHAMPDSRITLGGVLYVKESVRGNCSSWVNACDLQTALSSTVAGDEVWVAEGTYYPTEGTDRTISFQIKSGVAVYGGFDGTETTRKERDWVQNLTVLSGDLGVVGDSSDNSYHVVYGYNITSTALLDGFTITAGNANGGYPSNLGGGMFNYYHSSPTLTNVTFSANSAEDGGGMYNDFYSNPALTNVTFSGNSASNGGGMSNYYYSIPELINVTFSGNSAEYGGGMYNIEQNIPELTNVTFSGNSAAYGGGMYNYFSSSTLTNVTFFANSAEYNGGGVYNISYGLHRLTNVTFSGNLANQDGGGIYNYYSSPRLINSILWGNGPEQIYNYGESTPVITYSLVQGGYGGEGNNSGDPILGPLADNGGSTLTHFLGLGSPAIDSGSPTVCPATDQRGGTRPFDGNGDGSVGCDMGAYEYQPGSLFFNFLPLIVR